MASQPTPHSGFETLPLGKNWFPVCITWGHHPGSRVIKPARGFRKGGDTGTKQNPANTTFSMVGFFHFISYVDLNH